MKIDFEPIAKIVLGSGLFAFLIAEVVGILRRFKLKRRFKKEVAYEFIENEGIASLIIKDYQNLQKDPCGYLGGHKFKTHIINAVLTLGYFLNFSYGLSQLILEFHRKFSKVQYELDNFFKLDDELKIRNQELDYLKIGESHSRLLLDDLRKSKELKKIKKKYLIKLNKNKIKLREEKENKKMDKKEKKKLIGN